MGDLLRQGCQWLAQQRGAHCASPVTYRRPSTGSGQATEAVIDATFGRTACEVEDDRGLRVGAEVIDFLVSAEVFAPMFGEPEAGDQIVVPSTGSGQAASTGSGQAASTGSGQADGVVYEVMDLAGQGHWRWSGPYRTTMRIHTKEIGLE